MLLGFPVTIHTGHKNLLYPQESSRRVKRWKLLLEEYRLSVQYVPGVQNMCADAFSRLRYDYVKQATEDELLAVEEEEVAIDGAVLKKHQLADLTTKAVITRLEQNAADPDYSLRAALGTVLLHFKKRVVVPASLRKDLVELYHNYLLHPGAEKQFRSMTTYWWPGMETEVKKYVTACMQCKRAKLHGGKQEYGHLPPTPMTNDDRPFDVVHAKPISTKNPQTNAICERVHLKISNIIRARPDLSNQLEVVLDYAAYAIRASYHSLLRASPAQLLFGEDMTTRQLHFANWSYLSKQRFAAIMQENDRENLKRIQHFYQVGDQVMLRVPPRDRRKTEEVAKGPFLVKQVYDNGTVLIDKGATEERLNIRRIFPC
ncbi:unnamed protein product [Phytophthora fragariaefolia]|uniref:Unnamed protein product n=1 Tax=Phytophthora fragariaefolia TaxID=1490495 RepID=A0A9W6TVK2_9STRA|nr:unnamed protein product [Phytophthora fragariaefolia]